MGQLSSGLEILAMESGTWRRPLTLSLAAGSTALLLGRNGAGKTTFLNTIAGLTRISAGRLVLDGVDLTSSNAEGRVESGIRIALEGRPLFKRLSVKRNLMLGAYWNNVPDDRASDLEWVLSVFPMLRGKLEDLAGTLSGGQQTQVNIGRALMGRPKVLLLDEPTLGLDPRNVGGLASAILEVTRQRKLTTIIADQHVLMANRFPSQVLLMDGGALLFKGTLEEAKRSGALNALTPVDTGPC